MCTVFFVCKHNFSFGWDKRPRVQLFCHVIVSFSFLDTAKMFSRVTLTFEILNGNKWVIQVFHILSSKRWVVSLVFIFCHCDRYVVVVYANLILLEIFTYSYTSSVYSLQWNVCSCLLSILSLDYLFLNVSFKNIFIITYLTFDKYVLCSTKCQNLH